MYPRVLCSALRVLNPVLFWQRPRLGSPGCCAARPLRTAAQHSRTTGFDGVENDSWAWSSWSTRIIEGKRKKFLQSAYVPKRFSGPRKRFWSLSLLAFTPSCAGLSVGGCTHDLTTREAALETFCETFCETFSATPAGLHAQPPPTCRGKLEVLCRRNDCTAVDELISRNVLFTAVSWKVLSRLHTRLFWSSCHSCLLPSFGRVPSLLYLTFVVKNMPFMAFHRTEAASQGHLRG